MQIRDVLLAPGNGAFFYDDQAAIGAGAIQDGFIYVGRPMTTGFTSIRVPASSLSVGLVLSDDTVVWGDMMSVQYSGAGGRDPLFEAAQTADLTSGVVAPRLLDVDASRFVDACAKVFEPFEHKRLPLALEYGVSQALLRAAAHLHHSTMAEVICNEFDLPLPTCAVPIYCQSGDAREINVDKMILKGVDVLPHGLINSRQKFGVGGQTFMELVKWVAKRTRQIGRQGYDPVLHFDVYGWIGLEIGLDPQRIADFICGVADTVPGVTLNVECPADFGSTQAQIDNYARIVSILDDRGSSARIVVDERCNTLEDIRLFAEARAAHLVQIKTPDVGSLADTAHAVLLCKENKVGAYVGGSCTETDLSAQASVHISVATQADMMLAKPGMGVDEAFSIVGNEQNRLLAMLNRRRIQNENVG
ncbi:MULTISPECIES: methylaspartate ammonia-lyase [unclassified Mesorhizobium]|uniref:methylaspartate ammonia-lyase n=1 Tax=unclassified Mesorhizobium TaxID=325217 RepID=UPI000F755B4A|nr:MULTISPECIES: methylaspartate ammonia-lyase [unclassified Mesorhizobium]TGP44562.1 methylaspartate ammonia-lyase [bacterium M00.F.Ca.ET.230.01.1.1]TGP72949.1 methylaspartate ammonia-lyase [bacterium M00.F.Ca.ET.227.01.1.1]TGP99619.1 methylaspartate ammonia-lyase [bacterium M00.F.Ca.ET.221.01.1.1]TGQ00348.1 methylaspartate ammonia-lyase [bacterium M00.F.Ca.ET.222.01.1.1]TGT78802.1 methylaspartate ammonia-lyase [bacterium M00.F.Ca.ET.159.01.1.1]TGT89468.1 methylaspartate ammonia-lyase [bacte